MVYEPCEEELARLEAKARNYDGGIELFEKYLLVLSVLDEARDKGLNVKDFENAVTMARGDLDFLISPRIH